MSTYLENGIFGLMGFLLLLVIFIVIERVVAFNLIRKKLHNFTRREEINIELNSKLTTLHTIATSVVYIGLLGTVVGVIMALGEVETSSKKEMMSGLSYALVATASSLIVAIPATVAYNYLAAMADNIILGWDLKDDTQNKLT